MIVESAVAKDFFLCNYYITFTKICFGKSVLILAIEYLKITKVKIITDKNRYPPNKRGGWGMGNRVRICFFHILRSRLLRRQRLTSCIKTFLELEIAVTIVQHGFYADFPTKIARAL